MDMNLPAEEKAFVKSLVMQGKYESEEAAVADGVRLLMRREELRHRIRLGTEQLDRGESFSEDDVFDQMEAEIKRVESQNREG